MHQAEPSIYFGLVSLFLYRRQSTVVVRFFFYKYSLVVFIMQAVHKTSLPRHVTLDSLKACLQHLYHLVYLLNGSIQQLLDNDSTGDNARHALKSILGFVALQLENKNTWLHRELRNPFTCLASVPIVHLPTPCAAAVQSFFSRIIGRTVDGIYTLDAMILHKSLVLSSSLRKFDSARLYSLFALAFLPGGPQLEYPG